MSEWAASDRIASDPVANPTAALPIVSAADAAIEPSATCCFSFMVLKGRASAGCDRPPARRHSSRISRKTDAAVSSCGSTTGDLGSPAAAFG